MAEDGPSRRRAASAGATLEVEVVRHDEAWEGTAGLTDATLERVYQISLVILSGYGLVHDGNHGRQGILHAVLQLVHQAAQLVRRLLADALAESLRTAGLEHAHRLDQPDGALGAGGQVVEPRQDHPHRVSRRGSCVDPRPVGGVGGSRSEPTGER